VARAVRVEGLRELQRALKAVDSKVAKELRGELKDAAGHVASTAKGIAEFQGLRDTGKLINSIRPGATMSYAYVKESANRNGFLYPRIYEFGGRDVQFGRAILNRSSRGKQLRSRYGSALGSRGQFGPRAFLGPAVEMERPKVEAAVERILDRAVDRYGF